MGAGFRDTFRETIISFLTESLKPHIRRDTDTGSARGSRRNEAFYSPRNWPIIIRLTLPSVLDTVVCFVGDFFLNLIETVPISIRFRPSLVRLTNVCSFLLRLFSLLLYSANYDGLLRTFCRWTNKQFVCLLPVPRGNHRNTSGSHIEIYNSWVHYYKLVYLKNDYNEFSSPLVALICLSVCACVCVGKLRKIMTRTSSYLSVYLSATHLHLDTAIFIRNCYKVNNGIK